MSVPVHDLLRAYRDAIKELAEADLKLEQLQDDLATSGPGWVD